MKIKTKPIIKFDGQDKYTFINGVAQIPGTKSRAMRVTLREFNEVKEAIK